MPSLDSSRPLVHMIGLGCPKNTADSERLLGELAERLRLQVTAEPAEADLIVVNTCAFIKDATEEAVDTILDAARYKGEGMGRCRALVVMGCLAGRYSQEDLAELLPEVDCLLGPADGDRLAQEAARLLGLSVAEVVPGEGVEGDAAAGYTHEGGDTEGKEVFLGGSHLPRMLSRGYQAYIKIADGCDRACTFCTIPSIKGPQRSRTPHDIVAEVERLAQSGVKEFILVAQDSTAYGSDLAPVPGGGHEPRRQPDLTMLLEQLVEVPGVEWIRVLYAYPRQFPRGLVELMALHPDRICAYLDIPIQHVSDPVLRRMGRGHTGQDCLDRIEELRRKVPSIAIRTSLMVGFPGETEEDFAQLEELVASGAFRHLGVFVFSPEEGTQAAEMEPAVPRRVAVRRQKRLMSVQKKISLRHNRELVGTVVRVLVEGPHPETPLLLQGRTQQQAPEVDGVVLINDLGEDGRLPEPGEVVEVLITEAHHYDLVGELTDQ